MEKELYGTVPQNTLFPTVNHPSLGGKGFKVGAIFEAIGPRVGRADQHVGGPI